MGRYSTIVAAATLATALLAGCGSDGGDGRAPATAAISVDGDGLDVPDTVPAGAVAIDFTNDADVAYSLFVAKIVDESKDVDDFEALLDDPDVQAPPDWAEFAGAIAEIAGGESFDDYVVELDDDGEWVVAVQASGGDTIDEGEEAGGDGESFATALKVDGDGGADLPDADVTVTADDFSYAVKPKMKAGQQSVRITNTGKQDHIFSLVRLEGISLDDALKAGGEAEGVAFVGDFGYLDAGYAAVTHVDLEKGGYGLVCFLPDERKGDDGPAHFTLGMKREFSVG